MRGSTLVLEQRVELLKTVLLVKATQGQGITGPCHEADSLCAPGTDIAGGDARPGVQFPCFSIFLLVWLPEEPDQVSLQSSSFFQQHILCLPQPKAPLFKRPHELMLIYCWQLDPNTLLYFYSKDLNNIIFLLKLGIIIYFVNFVQIHSSGGYWLLNACEWQISQRTKKSLKLVLLPLLQGESNTSPLGIRAMNAPSITFSKSLLKPREFFPCQQLACWKPAFPVSFPRTWQSEWCWFLQRQVVPTEGTHKTVYPHPPLVAEDSNGDARWFAHGHKTG